MKKFFAALIWAALGVSCAGAKEVDGGFFTADIPSSWAMTKQEPAAVPASPKRDTVITVAKALTDAQMSRDHEWNRKRYPRTS